MHLNLLLSNWISDVLLKANYLVSPIPKSGFLAVHLARGRLVAQRQASPAAMSVDLSSDPIKMVSHVAAKDRYGMGKAANFPGLRVKPQKFRSATAVFALLAWQDQRMANAKRPAIRNASLVLVYSMVSRSQFESNVLLLTRA